MSFRHAQHSLRQATLNARSLAIIVVAMIGIAPGAARAGIPFIFANGQNIALPRGEEPNDLAVGDFNRDLIPDIVVAAQGQPHGFYLLLGHPTTPSYGSPVLVTVEAAAPNAHGGRGIAVTDMNNNGKLDVIFSRAGYGVTISPGNGNGTFADSIDVLLSPLQGELLWPLRIVTRDLDNDGDLDLILIDGRNYSIYVLRNDGNFVFSQTQLIPTLGATQMTVGDLNGDGLDDLIWCGSAGQLNIAMNTGLNTFGTPALTTLNPDGGPVADVFSDVEVIDIDLDGDNDLIMTQFDSPEGWMTVLANDGTGTQFAVTYTAIPTSLSLDMVVADFDGDQRQDVAVLDAGGAVWFVRNETVIPGQFEFSFPFSIKTNGFVSIRLVNVNLDNDCDHDLIALNKETSNIAVVTNFSPQFSQCTATDFDFDGLVGGTDLSYLLSEWGKANSPADLNLSGRVEGMDLAFLLWGWQQPIPQR